MSKHAYHRGLSSSAEWLLRRLMFVLGITAILSGATVQAAATAPAQVPDPNPSEITQPIPLVAMASPMAPVAPALNAPAAPAAPATPASVEHVVKKGDTYSKISNRHGADWECVANANGARSPYTIHPGDKITIPDNCRGGQKPGPETDRGPPAEQESNQESNDSGSSKAQQAVRAALSKDGAPYRHGAEGPNVFDCSGLVSWAYKKAGVNLPRTSKAMSTVGTGVSKDNLRPGDLLFFYKPVSHVAMYIGDGKIIQASTKGKPVHVRELDERRMKSFNTARRVA